MAVADGFFFGGSNPASTDLMYFWRGDAVTGQEGYTSYWLLDAGAPFQYWADLDDSSVTNQDAALLFNSNRSAILDVTSDRSGYIMPLLLEVISDHQEILGSDRVREFREDGGTIGRSLENDWILPDPDHFLSGSHAAIDFKAGSFYLVDTSTNGVFVNDEETPIGKGNPRRLFDGDRLKMGEFEFAIALACVLIALLLLLVGLLTDVQQGGRR